MKKEDTLNLPVKDKVVFLMAFISGDHAKAHEVLVRFLRTKGPRRIHDTGRR